VPPSVAPGQFAGDVTEKVGDADPRRRFWRETHSARLYPPVEGTPQPANAPPRRDQGSAPISAPAPLLPRCRPASHKPQRPHRRGRDAHCRAKLAAHCKAWSRCASSGSQPLSADRDDAVGIARNHLGHPLDQVGRVQPRLPQVVQPPSRLRDGYRARVVSIFGG
jgi:hypothetical protein